MLTLSEIVKMGNNCCFSKRKKDEQVSKHIRVKKVVRIKKSERDVYAVSQQFIGLIRSNGGIEELRDLVKIYKRYLNRDDLTNEDKYYIHSILQMFVAFSTPEMINCLMDNINVPHDIVPWTHYENPLAIAISSSSVRKVEAILNHWNDYITNRMTYENLIARTSNKKIRETLRKYRDAPPDFEEDYI